MPSKVYVNVENHKLLDKIGNGKAVEVEDVTKVGLPTIKHQTTTISSAGMVVDVDMPSMSHMDAMDYTITHNNGVNTQQLAIPGKHIHEFRTVRQRYDITKGDILFESVKFRLIGVHVETQKGDIETGSPYGSTDKFSCLRYEEEVNGKVITVVDAMAGVIKYGKTDYAKNVSNLLK